MMPAYRAEHAPINFEPRGEVTSLFEWWAEIQVAVEEGRIPADIAATLYRSNVAVLRFIGSLEGAAPEEAPPPPSQRKAP